MALNFGGHVSLARFTHDLRYPTKELETGLVRAVKSSWTFNKVKLISNVLRHLARVMCLK
jgi:hypothetical protein